jgi:hypothetical protein
LLQPSETVYAMPTESDRLNCKVLGEHEERPIMLKYASKLFLEIFISVVATVVGSYFAHRYIADKSAADAPVAPAVSTVDPKATDARAASEAVKADVTASVAPLDVASAPGPAATIGSRIVNTTNDEKAAPPADKPAEPTNAPARPHQSFRHEKPILKAKTTPAPETALTVASRDVDRAAAERFRNSNASLLPDTSPRQQDTSRDNGVSPPPEPLMRGSPFVRRVLNPIIHVATLLLPPSPAPVGHDDKPRPRTSPDDILSSSSAIRLQPEVTKPQSSERTRDTNDVPSSWRSDLKKPGQWP